MSGSDDDTLLDAVLVPRKGLTVVPVQDELVVYDRTGGGNLHRLDPRAALVWQLLDGTATVRETAAEIADAVGADPGQVTADVATLVRDLIDLNLVVEHGSTAGQRRPRGSTDEAGDDDASEDDPARTPPDGVIRMRRSPCYAALEAEGWHATDAVTAGPFVVGIRTSDEAARAAVRARFAQILNPNTEVDPNFSLRPAVAAAPGQPAQLAQVYAGCSLVGRYRTTEAALTQLARELQATAATAIADRPWFLGSVLLVEDRVVLAPGWLWPVWTPLASRLERAGVRLLGRHIALDTATGEAVLPALPPALAAAAPGVDAETPADQRFPIGAWLLYGIPPGERPAPAHAVALAAGTILNADRFGLERLLPALAELDGQVQFWFAPAEQNAALDLVRGAAVPR